jgi:Site-specific recombinase XerD
MSSNLPPFLTISKTGLYKFRRSVPARLREPLGLWEIKQTLGKEHKVAMQRYWQMREKTDQMFSEGKHSPLSLRDTVIRLLKKGGFEPSALDKMEGDDVDPDLSDALEAFHSILVDEYEDAERAGKSPHVSLEAIRAIGAEKLPPRLHTIATCLAHYQDAQQSGDATKDKALQNRLGNLTGRLEAAIGADKVHKRSIESLTRDDARRVRDTMLIDLHPNSVRRMLGPLRTAINQTIREFDLPFRNPFEALDIKGAGVSRDDRLPFTEQDMAALAPVMERGPDDTLSALWVILRDTGARLKEITSLLRSDVDLEQQSLTIRVGKTKNATRTVPLSPAAVRYLETITSGITSGTAPVFPKYSEGRGADSASAAMMKRLRTVIDDPKQSAYSLRHRMKDRLRDVDCPTDVQEEIMGHKTQDIARNYGRGYSLEQKRKYLAKVW